MPLTAFSLNCIAQHIGNVCRTLAMVAGLLTAAALTGCGEPPSLPPAQPTPAEQTSGTQTRIKRSTESLQKLAALPVVTPEIRPALTTEGLQAARAKLPKDAPEEAEIVSKITPGKRGGSLVYAVGADPKSFNPVFSDSVGDQEAQNLMFAGLYGYDQYEQHDIPEIAKSWEYDKATRTWTFHLRKGLKWSDGKPLTSDDFLFFTEVIFDPKIVNEFHLFLRQEGKMDSPPYRFAAPDPYTFTATIPTDDAFSLQNLGLVRPMPRHALEAAYKAGKFSDTWLQNVNPAELVVSGPFKLKTLRPGEAMVFERNPHYFRYDVEGTQLPYLDEVVAQIIPDSQATHVAFLAGKTDLQEGIDPQLLAQFLDEAPAKGFTVYPLGGSLNINHYFFNLNQGGTYPDAAGKQQVWQPTHQGEKPAAPGFKPFVDPVKLAWFGNREFRLACSEATNRQRMIDTVLYGQGEPLYGLVPPANREWYNPQAPIYPYNPTAAKARLDKLGWIDKDGDGIREDAQGHPIRFTLLTTRESNTREKILQLLKEDLRAVGLGAEAQVVQFNNLITRIQDTYDYDVIMLGLGTGVPPHPSMAGNTWRSAGDTHLGYPSQKAPMTPWEAELDRLYGSMKHSFDVKEQQKIYFEMQVIFNEAQPAIHTFTGKSFVAAKNRIGNLKPTIIRSSVTHNIQELYIR